MIKTPAFKKIPKRNWIALLIVLLMLLVAYLAYYRYQAANDSLDNLPVQMDKVLTAAQLQQNLVAQSYYMKGYMLYRDPKYLRDFRWLAEVNKRDIQELYEIVRPARKPLVEKIAGLQQQYTDICEAEIIPLVQKGDTAGAIELIMNTNLLTPLEQSISYAEELENMRALDTQSLFKSVIEMTRRNMLEAFTLIMLILAVVGMAGIPLAGRAARDNNIYRLILATTKNAIIIINRNGKVALINRVAEEIFGIARSSVMGRPFKEVFTGRKRTGEIAFTYPVNNILQTGEGICNNEKAYTDDDGWNYNLLVDCLQLQENGEVTGVMLLLRDITEQKVIEDKLKGLAIRDGMTLIYNHSYLKQVLTSEVEQASSRGSMISFMIFDLDNFKLYNDSFGHPAGDQLLKELALLIKKYVRAQDIVGRYGGDEFAVILPDADITAALEVAERLRAAIENFSFPYGKLMPGGKVTVSVGVACYPLQAKNAAELVRLADEAMYRAKRTTKNKVEVYSSIWEELALEEKDGENFLHSLEVIMGALKTKDPYTFFHSEKVALLANQLAKGALLDNDKICRVTMAALLHDLGKLEIPAEILNKPGPLTDEEWETVRRHPELGMDVVGQIKPFEKLAFIVLYHHEHYNGRGYPDGLEGDEIPLEARIIAIADAYDAMTSYRTYRPARTSNEALMEIERKAGVQFDPHLAGLFIKSFSNNQGGDVQGCILKKGGTPR